MKPRLADIMMQYHRVTHPVQDYATQIYFRSRFDSVRSGLGNIMREYDLMRHPIGKENEQSLVQRLNGLIDGLGPLIMKYDVISHQEHTADANEIPLNEIAERFNAVTGKGYSARQKEILHKARNVDERDRLQHFMNLALDLYEGLDGLSNRALTLHIQKVEMLIHSRLYKERNPQVLDINALNTYKAIEAEGPPANDIHLVFSELVAVIKDKRKIDVHTKGNLVSH